MSKSLTDNSRHFNRHQQLRSIAYSFILPTLHSVNPETARAAWTSAPRVCVRGCNGSSNLCRSMELNGVDGTKSMVQDMLCVVVACPTERKTHILWGSGFVVMDFQTPLCAFGLPSPCVQPTLRHPAFSSSGAESPVASTMLNW